MSKTLNIRSIIFIRASILSLTIMLFISGRKQKSFTINLDPSGKEIYFEEDYYYVYEGAKKREIIIREDNTKYFRIDIISSNDLGVTAIVITRYGDYQWGINWSKDIPKNIHYLLFVKKNKIDYRKMTTEVRSIS